MYRSVCRLVGVLNTKPAAKTNNGEAPNEPVMLKVNGNPAAETDKVTVVPQMDIPTVILTNGSAARANEGTRENPDDKQINNRCLQR